MEKHNRELIKNERSNIDNITIDLTSACRFTGMTIKYETGMYTYVVDNEAVPMVLALDVLSILPNGYAIVPMLRDGLTGTIYTIQVMRV